MCQDHAHVYIASARSIGVPARYVSGYLYTGDASDAASHAWVDVWLGPDIGWQSIDVTHKRPAVGNYCRLAVGRDYLDGAAAARRWRPTSWWRSRRNSSSSKVEFPA